MTECISCYCNEPSQNARCTGKLFLANHLSNLISEAQTAFCIRKAIYASNHDLLRISIRIRDHDNDELGVSGTLGESDDFDES